MKRRQKITWFLSGVLVATLVTSMVSPALALFVKTIKVQSGVNLYVDDIKLDPKDVNGNPIEVFLYNNTTYVPIRAVSEAFDVPIQWIGENSVYIGKHTGDKPAVWLSEMDYFRRTGQWNINLATKDNLGNEHLHSLDMWSGPSPYPATISYYLDGQYSRLTGSYYQEFKYRSDNRGSSTLHIFVDGTEIWNATVSPSILPVDFDLDISNTSILTFQYDSYSGVPTAIGDIGLWT